MVSIDDILQITTDAEFRAAAMELFQFQAVRCEPYAEYLRLIGVSPDEVNGIEQIPMLPIELFKTHFVYCGEQPPQKVFTSSATTGMKQSSHPMADVTIYERDFDACFRLFYGDPKEWSIYALLPNYLEREGSSLVYMADRLIAECGSGGFYLNNYDELIADMSADTKHKILLGVSYALWDVAECYAPHLKDVVVMETGGMKGRRKDISKEALHRILCEGFGVDAIHSEYGMAELTSQAYSSGNGIFQSPPWMRVMIRDVNNPFSRLGAGYRGGIDIIDLGNIYSCAFIATQDKGTLLSDGIFRVEGRIEGSDVRGCNLLIQ